MIEVGCTYRTGLLPHVFGHLDLIDVWEHTVDDFVAGAEEGLDAARRFADLGSVSIHSIGLSVGSAALAARPDHLRECRDVVRAFGADEISDHFAYSWVDGRRLHDFAPLWRVEEQLDLVVENVARIQDAVGVPLALENVACLFDPGGDMSMAEFANEVVRRSGCRLLLDISNLLINEANGLCATSAELDILDLDAVTGVHLAGGEEADGITWDAHHSPVPQSDLDWLRTLLPRMPNCRTIIIERDGRLQQGKEVVDDLRRVHAVVHEHEQRSALTTI